MALKKLNSLESQEWLVEYMKASIFTHDEKMNDLTFNSDEDELADNFIFRVKSVHSYYIYIKEIIFQTEKHFRDNILDQPLEDVLADYIVTPIKKRNTIYKLIEWIKTPIKGDWLKQHTVKPSPIVLAKFMMNPICHTANGKS